MASWNLTTLSKVRKIRAGGNANQLIMEVDPRVDLHSLLKFTSLTFQQENEDLNSASLLKLFLTGEIEDFIKEIDNAEGKKEIILNFPYDVARFDEVFLYHLLEERSTTIVRPLNIRKQ